MEQDERLYEYKMGSEVYRFDARSHAEAELMRGNAIQYFAEHLGVLFDEDALTGPTIVPMTEGFAYVDRPEKRAWPDADNPFPGP